MSAERDDEKFVQLADAIGPYLDRVVIVGGWAHRLLRLHSLALTLPYAPLMTRDTDVAIPPGMRIDEGSLRERLLARGFTEEFSGDDRPGWVDSNSGVTGTTTTRVCSGILRGLRARQYD
jgi:hypothetical protein